MDWILNNKWLIWIVVLLFVVIFFILVNVNNNNVMIFLMIFFSDLEVIENVLVKVYYDKMNLYILGILEIVIVMFLGFCSIV